MNAFYFCLIAGALYLPALFLDAIWKDLREVIKENGILGNK
jgi:hypothetical protein